MKGYLHVFRSGVRDGPHERRIPEYQLNYTAAGRTYVKILDEEQLLVFFREGVAMDDATITHAVDELRTTGRTTVGGLELGENDTYALGLKESQTDV